MSRQLLLKQWTPREDEQLQALIAEGHSAREIAVKLHRSLGAVYRRASDYRLKFKRAKVGKPAPSGGRAEG